MNPVRLFAVLNLIWLFLQPFSQTQAVLSSCQANVNPSSVTPGSTNNFSISLFNSSQETITYIQVNRPSDNFTINSHSIGGGWSVDQSSSTITLTGSILNADGAMSLDFSVTAGSNETGSANWSVSASDDEGGSDSISCTGSLGTSISSTTADTDAPTISNIVVSDVKDTSVKVTFDTDESASSRVDYGTSEEYGSSTTGSSGQSHSLSISSLNANTTYHYNITVTDGDGNSSESGDNTFVTANTGSTGATQTGTSSNTSTSTAIRATPTPTPDRAPPSVKITTDLENIYKDTPLIQGIASDVSGVSKLFYSIDNGLNWLPVEADLGGRSIPFSFSPSIYIDGDFNIRIKAVDGLGNSGLSKSYTLIIDRLPPKIGTFLVSLGPQIFLPQIDGKTTLLSGINYKLTLSAIGGPNQINLLRNFENLGSLVKNPENGLWSDNLYFDSAGVYTLSTKSEDGAANRTDHIIGVFNILPQGRVLDLEKPITGAELNIYYQDIITKNFLFWDASPYCQTNPLKTDLRGQYSLILPAGIYFLKVKAPGYKDLISDIFTLDKTTHINQNFRLDKSLSIDIFSYKFSLPNLMPSTSAINIANNPLNFFDPFYKSQPLPDFYLTSNGKEINQFSFRGKPTVFAFLNTWLPYTSLQLSQIEEFSKQADVNTIVFTPQESTSSIAIFAKRGGYGIPIIADPDGEMIDKFSLTTMPTYLFISRNGLIQKRATGLLTAQQMMENLY
jgi:hypothetical protein